MKLFHCLALGKGLDNFYQKIALVKLYQISLIHFKFVAIVL